MRAIIWTTYGPPEVLELRDIEKPVPGEDQILVRVLAAGVTAGDCEMRRLALPLGLGPIIRLYAGLAKPKRIPILGQELAGEVVEVGKQVNAFQPGDLVYGTTGFGFGAYAEYICLPAEPGDAQGILARKPSNLSPEEAAVLPTAGLEALHALQNGKAGPGKKVLIIGGGGSIGSCAIQLAKYFGAQVTGVDRTNKLELMRALGADLVIDYTKDHLAASGELYDVVIDVVGRKGLTRRLKLLKPGGNYYLAFARPIDLLLSIWINLSSQKKLRIESSSQTKEDLEFLTRLIESEQVKPVIDRVYPLSQAVEAHRYAESGEKKGNLALHIKSRK